MGSSKTTKTSPNFLKICVLISLLSIPIIIASLYLILFSVNVPIYDQWDSDISLGVNFYKGEGSITDLLSSHNDHRPIIPNIVMVSSHIISHFNVLTEIVISFIIYILSFFILFLLIIRKSENILFSLVLLIPVTMYYFNLYEIGPFMWGISVYFSVCLLSAITTFYALDRSIKIDKWYLVSIFSAICCMFSFSSGLLIWIAGLLAIILKPDIQKKFKIILWSIFGVIFNYINYVALGFKPAAGYSEYQSFFVNFLNYPVHKSLCFLGTIGSNVNHNPSYSIFCGLVISGLLLCIVIFNRNDLDLPKTSTWYGLICYSLLVSFFLTLSRSGNGAQFGPIDMILFIPGNRHFPSTILLLIAIYCLSIHYLIKERRILKTIISLQKKSDYNIDRYSNSVFFASSLIILIILGSLFHIAPGLHYGLNWYSNYYETAISLQDYNKIPDDKLKLIHPNPLLVKNLCNYLEKNKLNIFDTKNQSLFFDVPIFNEIQHYILGSRLSSLRE